MWILTIWTTLFEKFQIFDTNLLPKNMSKLAETSRNVFWDLIDHRITFDFLMGNFTNVFKREMFLNNNNCLDVEKLKDNRLCSNFDNCCGYIKVCTNAFKDSKFFILDSYSNLLYY